MILKKRTEECRCGTEVSGRFTLSYALRALRHIKKEHADVWVAARQQRITAEEMVNYLYALEDGTDHEDWEYVEEMIGWDLDCCGG